MARASVQNSLLTIISDGIDQAKFKIPHLVGPRVHALDKFMRPSLHITGLWAHGHALHMVICPPDIPKDSWTHIESLSRLLDAVKASGSLPVNLHIQLDNCPRDNKNVKILRFALMLTKFSVFRSVTVGFLRKGHTHEDIDGIFGHLAVCIAKDVDVGCPLRCWMPPPL